MFAQPSRIRWVYGSVICMFFILFVIKSIIQMTATPLHDYDEANRAEGARQMNIHHEWFFPVTGSPFLRNESQKILIRTSPPQYIYRHFERPPLAFWTMIASTQLSGQTELFFRLPSFLFAWGIVVLTIAYAGKRFGWGSPATCISAVLILTSSDIWLSGNYAMLDTTLTFFLIVSLVSLLVAQERTSSHRIFMIAGILAGFAILSKGQQAAIIAFPVVYLFFSKRISLTSLVAWGGGVLAVVLPWFAIASVQYGFAEVFNVFVLGFVKSRATVADATQKAPLFWYVRYWFDSFRPGIFVFGVIVARDMFSKHISHRKQTLLAFIVGTFVLYSLAPNKVWWYVMPAIPAIVMYVAETIHTHVPSWERMSWVWVALMAMATVPLALYQSNSVVLAYGAIVVLVGVYLFKVSYLAQKHTYASWGMVAVGFLALFFFAFRFPHIIPTYPEAKEIGEKFRTMPGTKCLYVQNVPYESILFYSKANSVEYLTGDNNLSTACINYLVTPTEYPAEVVYSFGRLRLHRLTTTGL